MSINKRIIDRSRQVNATYCPYFVCIAIFYKNTKIKKPRNIKELNGSAGRI